MAVVLGALVLAEAPARAHPLPKPFQLDRLNRRLHGRVIDHTFNHGVDRRIWSPALGERRDLYVYVPPGFDPGRRYPLVLFLHGFGQDEKVFLEAVGPLDRAIACGKLPPVLIAAPDGSLRGLDCLLTAGTFFLNSNLGAFEDFLMVDVWDFVLGHYPVRPEREAHALLGVSMGGGAAFNMAIKYRDRVGVVLGVFPPLNTRWVDCHGRYMSDFDPCCWGWRTRFPSHEVVGRFYGVIPVTLGRVISPLYGRRNPSTLARVIAENPVEMLALYDVKPGELEMYVAYAGRDEFNLGAQVESFLYVARHRGLEVGVGYDPEGHHNARTGFALLPGLIEWLRPRLEPYAPP